MLSAFGKTKHSLAAAAAMLRGFHSVYPLTDVEKNHIRLLIACRLACSCTFGAYSLRQNPENEYLLLHAQPAWNAMELIWGGRCDSTSIDNLFNLACQIPEVKTERVAHLTNSAAIDCSDVYVPDPSVYDVLKSSRVQTINEAANRQR